MPRTYTSINNGSTQHLTSEQMSGGIKAESVLLGNTSFDDINNPITAFNFVLEVEALYFLPLKSVKAFTKENEFEYIREGGVNDYVHLKRKPISKPFTFQVERYVGTERFLDPLALGTELVLPLALYVYRHKARQGLSKGTGEDAMPARVYLFTGCTVMSKDYGELDAERSSLLTETTTISYRELIVITNPFNNAEKAEWNFKDYKNTDGTYSTKYAAFAKNDEVNSGTYAFKIGTDQYGNRTVMRKPEDTEHHDPWDGSDKAEVKWAQESGPDKADATYEVTEKDGQRVVRRKDVSDYNRPQYEMSKDMDNRKYATEAYLDQNTGEKIYDKVPDERGKKHTKRVDHAQVNKPAWDGSRGIVNAWAKPAGPDKNNTVYKVDTKDGVSTVKRTDSSDFNRPQYELKKNKRKQLYSTVAYNDQNPASPTYKVEGDTVTRVDKSDLNKPQYEMKKNRQSNRYASKAPNKDPELREQYEMKIDGKVNKYAAIPKDNDKRAELKAQYEYKKDYKNNKYAAVPKDNDKRAELKAQYEYKKDGINNKYAVVPKDDKVRPVPVTWPPTRRALMADMLKK